MTEASPDPASLRSGSTLRVVVGRVAVALFIVGAALGVVAILSGQLTKLHAKIILTTWGGAFYLGCALACATARESGPSVKGQLGLVTSLGGFVWFLFGVWQQGYQHVWFWKGFFYLSVVSVTLAQAALLAADRRHAAGPRRLASWAAEIAAWVLCATTVYMVLQEQGEDPALWRIVGVASLIDLAASGVVVILRRLESGR